MRWAINEGRATDVWLTHIDPEPSIFLGIQYVLNRHLLLGFPSLTLTGTVCTP